MFQLSDLFKIGFSCMNQKPSLEDKLSNQNLPLEDFLKDDEAVSTTKFMGKNAKKYLNSEKIKKLIKLITEEPKEDDQLHGHKYPYVAYEILKLDCPFISKRFVLNEQEYHEEYPESPDDENGDWGLDFDIENENENNEIEKEFKENKIEFDKIYAKINEDFKNLKKIVSLDKERIRSKDDDYKDEYKYENNEDNNCEEGYEEYEENKEDNFNDDNNELGENNQQKHEDKITNDKDEKILNIENKNIKEDKQNKKEEKIEKEDIKINNEIKHEINSEEKQEGIEKEEINKKNENEDNKEIKDKEPDEDGNKILKKENKEIKEETGEKLDEKINDKKNENEKIIEGNKEEIIVDKKEENKTVNIEEEKEEIKTQEKEVVKEEEKEKNQKDKKENIKGEEEGKNEIKKDKKDDINEKGKEENKEEKNNEIKQEVNEIKEQKKDIKNEEQKMNEEKNDKDKKEQIETQEKQINAESIKEETKEKENLKDKNEEEQEKFKPEKKEIKEEKIEIKEKDNINIIQEKENQTISSKNPEIKESQENTEKVLSKEKEKNEKKLETNNQEEETNEEMNNIIIDKNEEEKEKDLNNKNINPENQENIDNLDEADKSLSVEGELDDENQKKSNKKKKNLKNNQSNEYLDLLLNFVMSDKPELNYVLSGYFVNVLLTLLANYPYKILKYLYTQRRDALKKIIFHSNQKAFAILSSKLLNIESYIKPSSEVKESINDLINENIPYRNELIREIINSINLQGMQQGQGLGMDIEAIFALISDLINENNIIAKELIFNDYLCPHLFDILDTNLYSDLEKYDESDFNTRYKIYCLFINLTSKFLKVINNNYSSLIPLDFDFNSLQKNKTELHFNDNMIISFGKILKNNFLAKKPTLILEKNSSIVYEGLGALNLHILDLVKNMFYFMKALPKQFDLLLIRNYFCQRSMEFFFKYQWNNIYQNKFVEYFTIYLENEERHNELTQYYFDSIKLQNLLVNFLEEKMNEKNNIFQKIKYEFKSGKKITSGIYPHVIDLMYKIQTYSDLEVFTEEEQQKFSIMNLGEFEFSKDEKSNKFIKKINISNNLKEIISKDEKWSSVFKNTVLPVLRKYEGKLCKKPKIIDDDDDIKKEYGSNNLLLQKMINVLKRGTRASPLSRNDKNSGINFLIKNRNEKSSIREKLLSKGYKSRHIFDDDDDEDKKDKENKGLNSNIKNDDKNEVEEDNNKIYNDTNYWELKNDLPENIKKEVDKKTNIIFNYNPITGENEKKSEISEEDELLSIAMDLEQNEKMEKNKKIMYIMPGKLKPINLKTKSNPVQNIFINITNNNKTKISNNLEKIKNKKKDVINLFYNDINNENEEHENENEEEGIIKKEEDKNDENNTKTIDNTNNIKEEDDEKMFNEVNYWKNNDYYLNKNELEDIIKDL